MEKKYIRGRLPKQFVFWAFGISVFGICVFLYLVSKYSFASNKGNDNVIEVPSADYQNEEGSCALGKDTDFIEVPFTCYQDKEYSYVLEADTDRLTFKLKGDTEITCPQGYLPLKVLTIQDKQYIFCKKLFDESTCLLEVSRGNFQRIELPEKFKEFIFRDAVYFEDRLETALFFVVYNTEISSNQLYKFKVDVEGNLEYIDAFCTDLNFGDNNVDENVKMIVSELTEDFNGNKGLYILGTQYYYVYQTWVPYILNRYPYDYEARLTETYDNGKEKFYLTYSESKSMMFLYNINNMSFREDLILNEDTITGTIDAKAGKIKEVAEGAELLALLEKDITALQCGGVIEMGSNNLEGRIPWAQVYYLNGFIDFLMPEFSENITLNDFKEFQTKVGKRVDIELEIMDQLICSEQGLVSKRYHLNRNNGVSALHCDRVMQTLNRYSYYTNKSFRGYNKLYKWGVQYYDTVERPVIASEEDINGVGAGREYLLTWDGALFDRTVAPYNYMSAYVSSVCLDKVLHGKIDDEYCERARQFINILLEDEKFRDFDSEYEWSYFFGETYNGWEMDYERNIPYFTGQTYCADISYRSMDAMAIIYAFKAVPELYDQQIIDYIRTGVENGKLFPFVNEALIECGYDKAEIPVSELREWLRIHHDWNIQNTAWAYYFLLR